MDDSDACRRIVLEDLARRAGARRIPPDERPPPVASGPAPPPIPNTVRPPIPILLSPVLSSARFLSERGGPDCRLLAVDVEDEHRDSYLVIAEVARDPDGRWHKRAGLESPRRTIAGRPDPWLNLSAHWTAGRFMAGGPVQTARGDIARVQLRWNDGTTAADTIENGIALFLLDRIPEGGATVEFYDASGALAATHLTLVDEPEPPRNHR